MVPKTRDDRFRNVTGTIQNTLDRHRLGRPLQQVGEANLYTIAACEFSRQLRIRKIATCADAGTFIPDVRGF